MFDYVMLMLGIDFNEIFYATVSVGISITILLGHVVEKCELEIIDKDKNINVLVFCLHMILYMFSGLVAFLIAYNAFNAPNLTTYEGYRYIGSMIFGGFGTITIPAIHKGVELVIEKSLFKVKNWSNSQTDIPKAVILKGSNRHCPCCSQLLSFEFNTRKGDKIHHAQEDVNET